MLLQFPSRQLYAKVGNIQDPSESGIIRQFAYGDRNKNGEELVDFAVSNSLQIMNTSFPVHPRRLYTWTEPDGETRHQIDYIAIQRDHAKIIRSSRTLPGADCGSDHEPLIADIKMKLRCKKRHTPTPKYDVENIDSEFSVAVKNRFSQLASLCEEKEPEEIANSIRDIFKEEASKHLKRKTRKQHPWISEETLQKIELRKVLKKTKNSEPGRTQYKAANKEIKQLCKRDKKKLP